MSVRVKIILLVLAITSVVIRLPNLNRPLSDHHEWLTAHTLITLDIWKSQGAGKYFFAPVYTFPGELNKNISNEGLGGIKDKSGNYYYVSYPPFSFILPYFIFNLTGLSPSILGLQILNVLIHLTSAFLVFHLTVELLSRKRDREKIIGGLVSYTLYLYSPIYLWFGQNVYFAEILGQFFLVLFIFLFIKFINLSIRKPVHILILGLTTFFLIYTDWTLLVMIIPFLMLTKIKFGEWKDYSILIMGCVLGIICGLMLTYYQYSNIAGPDILFSSLIRKYEVRSGMDTGGKSGFGLNLTNVGSYRNLLENFKLSYQYILVLLVILGSMFYAVSDVKIKKLKGNNTVSFMVTLFISVALHHILFFNFTVSHDFSLLKSGIWLSVLTGIIFAILEDRFVLNRLRHKRILIFTLLLFITIMSIRQYIHLNKVNYAEKRKKLGETIKKDSQSDEVVVLKGEMTYIDPQILYYTGRNIITLSGDQSIESVLKKYGQDKAAVFVTGSDYEIKSVIRYNVL